MNDLILIGSPSAEDRNQLRGSLQASGYQILEAQSDAEILRLMYKHPDLIILDTELALPAERGTGRPPVIRVSSEKKTGEEQLAIIDSGADAFVALSADPLALLSTVKSWLRISRSAAGTGDRGYQERGLYEFFMNAPLPIAVLKGPDLIYFLMNDPYREHFAREDILGKPLRSAFPELEGQGYFEILETVFHTGNRYIARETRAELKRGGEEFPVFANLIFEPERDMTGKIVGVIIMAVDVSEQVVARQQLEFERSQLEQERSRLKNLVMSAPVPVAVLSGPEHFFEIANPAYQDTFGRHHVIGQTIREAYPEIEHQGFYNLLDTVYKTGQPFRAQEIKIELDRGSGPELFYLDLLYEPERDTEGNVRGILVFASDITAVVQARQRAEKLAEELQIALSARDTFLGIASHELKTPLTSLKLQNQMLQRQLEKQGPSSFSSDWVEKMVANSVRQAGRLNRLVDDMLDVSRIASGKLTMHFEDTNLTSLVKDTIERFESQIDESGCVLRERLQKDVKGYWDPHRIEQVITNLMANAIKYAPGKPIEIGLETAQDVAVLKVRDWGRGVTPHQLERIFERFERGVSESEVSGLGLGLFISRQIVESHGGRIEVQSTEGEGAEFTVNLPIEGKMAEGA